ncbi:spore coat protein [Domibacillus indicus]|uniref:spore coat protein n=1 Tax=Domibacillus indicus TaxID=1437523 RepID=UPI000698CBFE|nr:spore coat protein [Domibacillus indicus]
MRKAVAVEYGDVTGDRVPDIVYLTAVQTPGSAFLQQITLAVQCGRTARMFQIPLPQNAGYNPGIFLGDFTGNRIKDILAVINTGGSGGTIYAYAFSFRNGRFEKIFDGDAFNEKGQYAVRYQNHYRVEVTSEQPDKRYVLDITTKGEEYINEIYAPDGTLKEPIEGWVSPLTGLYPVDFERDGIYELLAYQNIAGRYSADRLGYMENVLTWTGQFFESGRQYVAVLGEEKPE